MVKLKSLKVAFFHPDLGIGGAERLVLDVAIALYNQGYEVVFVTNHFDKSHAFEELKDGKYRIRVVGDWLPRSVFGLCQALCAYFRMMYLALIYVLFLRHQDQPDLYVVDQIPMAVPFLKWTKPNVIYYCHHPDLLASPPGGVIKRLYRKPIDSLESKGTAMADVILVNSRYTADVFRATFPTINRELRILYPTISSAYQSAVKKPARKPMHELLEDVEPGKATDVYFLSINRFHPAKNLELALLAMSVLKRRLQANTFRRVHLILAGGFDPNSTINDSYFAWLVGLCDEEGLGDKVVFLKSPSDQLKVDLLTSCSCLIYTPVNEHFGIVPLEAMAASKPVIACNSGGPRETVVHGVTGFLCEPNGDSVSESMGNLLDPGVAKHMGKAGRKRLEQLFSYDAFSSNVLDIVNNSICNKKEVS